MVQEPSRADAALIDLGEAPAATARQLLDAANFVGTWDWDIAADRVHANARFADLYSVDPERALAGAPLADFVAAIHPEDRQRVRSRIDAAIAGDGAFGDEYRVIDRDGRIRWVLVYGSCQYDAAGQPTHLPGSAIDITDRKTAEVEQARLVRELQQEKARLQAVLDHVPFGVVFAEAPSGRIVSGNRQVEKILRHPVLPTPDIGSHGRWIGYHPDGRAVQPEEYPLARAILFGEASGPEDYLYRRGDGSLAWVQLTASPIRGADGEVVAGVVSIADIDEDRRTRKQQAALGVLSDRLRDAREPADIAGIAAEALGRALSATRAGYGLIDDQQRSFSVIRDWCDFSTESIVGTHQFGESGSDYIASLRLGQVSAIADIRSDPRTAAQAERFAAQSTLALVTVPLFESGRLLALIFVSDGQPRNWTPSELGLVREVANRVWTSMERVRSELALRESELRFRAITESMPQIVWSTLPDGSHDFFNQRWYDFTGLPRGASDGDGWITVVHPDDQPRTIQQWRHSLASGELYEIENRLRRHDGFYHWALGRAVPMRDEHGVIVRWFGTCTDIDDQVRARELLAQSSEILEREVLARTAELRSTNQRLTAEMTEREKTEERLRQSQKMEAVGQLTGGIAHDFNNLMTGIIGSLGQLQKRLDPAAGEELVRYVDIALASANRAAALTHRLLAFSRRQSLDTRTVDVVALVASMEELLRRTLGETITLDVAAAEQPWSARTDENQLESALLNLVINARDAMPHGGQLRITVGNAEVGDAEADDELRCGDYVVLAVTDSGTGMPADVIARAFDPFFTTKPIGQGTGLGLSMVYGFVRQIGGQVRIDSELGRGTTVKLYLPRDPEPAALLPSRVQKSPMPPVVTAPRSGGTILVVEDDEGVRMLVTEFLVELGYTVLQAADGVGGLRLATDLAQPIDLLLTDVGLPGMNGRQLADAVRVLRPQLKVLFMTGYAETAIVRSGFLGPGMSMLTKPFTLDALVGKVERILAEPAPVV